MSEIHGVLCIGAANWDTVGYSTKLNEFESDVPGRVSTAPGGVALHVAVALKKFGIEVFISTAIGADIEGDAIARFLENRGVDTQLVVTSDKLPTARYVAVETKNTLVAGVADCAILEQCGPKILRKIHDAESKGDIKLSNLHIVVDSNLAEPDIRNIAKSPMFVESQISVAAASTGKIGRIMGFSERANTTIYLNRPEAEELCRSRFASAKDAASSVREMGFERVVVTDSRSAVVDSTENVDHLFSPEAGVPENGSVGAGDNFMAGHIFARLRGMGGMESLELATTVAGNFIEKR